MKKVLFSGVFTAIIKSSAVALLLLLTLAGVAVAQRDKSEDPTAAMDFLVVKDDNGKPVRNAAIIIHPVETNGKQSRGGLELKTDIDGKTSFDGVPYGTLRVQVLASGFQTYGEDFTVDKAKLSLTIKLKRPQGQYSLYQDHPEEKNNDKNSKNPPPDPNAKPQ